MNKVLALVFVFMVLSSLMALTVKPVVAQVKLSVPQINSITFEANQTITVTIKNQPFMPYTNADGETCNLYYTVQIKGYFEDESKWHTFMSDPYDSWFFIQSSSGYTVRSRQTGYYVEGSQLDFRVQAFTGYWGGPTQLDHLVGLHESHIFRDESSDWSSVQTVIVPGGFLISPSPTTTFPANPSATSDNNQLQLPNQPQSPSFVYNPFFLLWIGTLIIASIVITVVIVLLRRPLKSQIT